MAKVSAHKSRAKGDLLDRANRELFFDSSYDSALMWYFVGWHDFLGDWSYARRRRYALDMSRFALALPFWMNKVPPVGSQASLDAAGVKYVSARDSWVLLDEDGVVLKSMTGVQAAALFYYLVDSLAVYGYAEPDGKGGFGLDSVVPWVGLAKKLIVRDDPKGAFVVEGEAYRRVKGLKGGVRGR